jgi:hypothetical protein
VYRSGESCGGGSGGGGGSGARLYNSRWAPPVTEENGNLTNAHRSFSRPTLRKADAIDVADSKLIYFFSPLHVTCSSTSGTKSMMTILKHK